MRLFGGPVGVTVTVVAIAIGAIWVAVVAADSYGGGDMALAVIAAATILCWTLGTDLVIDPWQPNVLLLPFFALLVVTAAVLAGKHPWLPAVADPSPACASRRTSDTCSLVRCW